MEEAVLVLAVEASLSLSASSFSSVCFVWSLLLSSWFSCRSDIDIGIGELRVCVLDS